MRADQLVLSRGMAPTRSAAQRLIEAGGVRWLGPKGWAAPKKAGEDLPEDCQLEVINNDELRFVSRGGLKLEGALEHTKIDVTGASCLDLGQGTGGFSDALLQRGAKQVVGIDVGHGQLNPRLATDERVKAYEGLNARDVTGSAFKAEFAPGSFDIVTGDVSFITMTHVLGTVATYLSPTGHFLMLVKPQFELQPAQIGKGGIVRDKKHFVEVENRIWQACKAVPLKVHAYFQSPIAGGNGNTEFFVWAQHPAAKS